MGEGYAFQCESCNGRASWRLLRVGDAAVTWACHEHLAAAALRLQRAHEKTELRVALNSTHPAGRLT